MDYQQPPPPPGGQQPQQPMERPTGVTILAVLYAIQGIMYLAVPALLSAIFGAFMALPGFLEAGIICWTIFGIIALICFVIAYGLWIGKNWARILAIIFAILGLFNFPIGTIISIIILIYLFKDDVKMYFK